ncbi:MAG: hypothetical protein COB49_08635 [Alphaproteobacteria bacterium]|nr:MAG: hypothetical protein COB49_08635 [Alphaproteobacteria bacterium]
MKKIEPAFGVELNEPYFTDKKWVSPFNWWPEVREQMATPPKVLIHDVTLRDGEQMARVAFTPEEKIFLALELDKLGVHSIEPGLPVIQEDKDVIKKLSEMNLNAKIVPLTRVMESDVRAVLDSGADGMLLEFGINPYLMKMVYKTDPNSLLDQIVEYAQAGKDAGLYVEFMAWDVFRIPDIGFMQRFFEKLALRAPVDRITVADTFGMGHPMATYSFIQKLKAWTGKPIGFHIHNDFAMATAGAVMAVSAGADMVHSSINGLGERSGNLATEEIAFVLQHLLDIDSGINLELLKPTSDLFAEVSKLVLARNKPIVGSGLFEVESGIVVHLVEKLKNTGLAIFPFEPEAVGHKEYEIILGRGTGVHSIKRLLRERGLEATDDQIERICTRVKQAGLMIKNGLPKSMVDAILKEELRVSTP